MYHRFHRIKRRLNYCEARSYVKKVAVHTHSVSKTLTKRVRIPTAVREQIWEKECLVVNGYKTLTISCPICDRETEKKHCHLAHKVSLHHGGTNSQKNLFYICSQCNQSMGTMSSDVYKKLYYE